MLDSFLYDLRYALRRLVKNPGFTVIAVLTLAVGIGATTAVFSVVDRILFRSLPYPQAERLVTFGFRAPIEPQEFMLGTDYVEWRGRQTAFQGMTSMLPGVADCDLTDENPARLGCARVESTFLSTLGIQPIVGRNFTREEDRPNAPGVALLSYTVWRGRFGGDASVVGKMIPLEGKSVQVVGVLPADFEMPTLADVDILLPQALDEARQVRPQAGQVLRAFARLKPGVNEEQAKASLQALFAESLQFVPAQFRNEVQLSVRSLRDRQIQDSRLASWILLGAVLAVLLVACTNVASLLLAKAAGRQRETAMRVALGASRGRLVRQSLAESLLLGVFGGAAGCWIAYALLRVFVSIAPEGILRLQQASLDLRVLLFALGASLVCGVLFGLVPALQRVEAESLTGRSTAPTRRGWLRQLLVTAQIAVSLVLLAGAGLLLRSFWNLQAAPLGMNAESVVTVRIVLGEYKYPQPAQQQAFFEEVEARLGRLPGVTSLTASDSLPPSGRMTTAILASMEVAGRPRFAQGTGGMVGYRSVTPGYFSTLGIPIVQGRGFREEDRLPGGNSMILSESLVRMLFPGGNALNQQIRVGLEGPWRAVIGVAGDVKNNGLAVQAGPEFYLPWKRDPEAGIHWAFVALRSGWNAEAVANWARGEIAAMDPKLPLEIAAMNQRVGKLAERPRFNAALLSLFAAMGLALAAIGIYGVVAFLVAQRTKEIGVRMALGATPRGILKMMLGHVARWAAAGAVLGLAGTLLAARFLETLLYQVAYRDPRVIGAAVALLVAVVFVAAWGPTRRATKVDPMEALRYE